MDKLRVRKMSKVRQKESIIGLIFLFLRVFSLSFLFSCKLQVKTLPSPPPSLSLEVEEALDKARNQLERGCYLGFKKAFETLKPLISSTAPWAELKTQIIPLYIKSGLLLGMREKEIGLATATLDEFSLWLDTQADWAEWRDFYEIVRASPVQAKGVMAYDDRQIDKQTKIEDSDKWRKEMARIKEEEERRRQRLEMKAQEDELAAYFWLSAFFNFINIKNLN